jgi:uncharacterized protein with FMN-binding domain
MRRIVLWFAATVTIVVLLFGYHTSTNKSSATVASSSSNPSTTSSTSSGSGSSGGSSSGSGSSGSGSSGSGSSSSGSGSSSSGSSSGSSSSSAKTYTGSVAQTRWGLVQVQITVQGSKITKVTVLQQPNGNHRDEEINSQALPILISDTLSAQSAQIDMVSGATVTSEGYLSSLQAALDEAGIK